jgi:hypothetical protein
MSDPVTLLLIEFRSWYSEHMADDPPVPPAHVQFPLQDEAPRAFIYSPADLAPPSPAHDPAPTLKRSIWILRLIFLVVVVAVIIGLVFMDSLVFTD